MFDNRRTITERRKESFRLHDVALFVNFVLGLQPGETEDKLAFSLQVTVEMDPAGSVRVYIRQCCPLFNLELKR